MADQLVKELFVVRYHGTMNLQVEFNGVLYQLQHHQLEE